MIPKQKQREVKKLMPNSSMSGANEASNSITSIIGNEIDKVNTSIPGIIQSYDAGSNRAVVVPTGKRTFPDGRKLEYPAIYDVPVDILKRGDLVKVKMQDGSEAVGQFRDFIKEGKKVKLNIRVTYKNRQCVS